MRNKNKTLTAGENENHLGGAGLKALAISFISLFVGSSVHRYNKVNLQNLFYYGQILFLFT